MKDIYFGSVTGILERNEFTRSMKFGGIWSFFESKDGTPFTLFSLSLSLFVHFSFNLFMGFQNHLNSHRVNLVEQNLVEQKHDHEECDADI